MMSIRTPTFCIISILFLVNTPRGLVMMNMACRYAQNCQIELLTLQGSIFVNFYKYSYGSIKSHFFFGKFSFVLASSDLKSNLGMFPLVSSFQNWYWKVKLGKIQPSYGYSKLKNHAMSVIKSKNFCLVTPFSSPKNDMNAPK